MHKAICSVNGNYNATVSAASRRAKTGQARCALVVDIAAYSSIAAGAQCTGSIFVIRRRQQLVWCVRRRVRGDASHRSAAFHCRQAEQRLVALAVVDAFPCEVICRFVTETKRLTAFITLCFLN